MLLNKLKKSVLSGEIANEILMMWGICYLFVCLMRMPSKIYNKNSGPKRKKTKQNKTKNKFPPNHIDCDVCVCCFFTFLFYLLCLFHYHLHTHMHMHLFMESMCNISNEPYYNCLLQMYALHICTYYRLGRLSQHSKVAVIAFAIAIIYLLQYVS